jgi:hypothetical protein
MTIEFIYYLTTQLSSKNYKEVIELLEFSKEDITKLEVFIKEQNYLKYE